MEETSRAQKATSLTIGDLANIMFVGDLTYENKWSYVSLGALVGLIDLMVEMDLISEAEGEQAKNEFTSLFPEGMYFIFVNRNETTLSFSPHFCKIYNIT